MVRVAPIVTLALALLLGTLSTARAQGYPTLGDSMVEPARADLAQSMRRFNTLAPKLVASAGIKPGDLVTITGGLLMVREMEALGVEVQKAGGRPLLLLDSPRLTRQFYAEVPEQYLTKIPSSYEKFAAQNVAVAFYLPTGEDFASLRRVDRRAQIDEALAKTNAASAPERNRGITRTLFISIPTPSDSASIQTEYQPYAAMSWNAIEADYSAIQAKGQEIKRILQTAKQLRVTSPEGTDFTVALGKRPVIVSAGLVPAGTKGTEAERSSVLPGGTVRFAPIESSATGKIRAAEDQCDQLIRDEAVDVEKGMPVKISAASDEECLKRSFKNAGRFGSIVIGLNPAVQFSHIPSYAPQLEMSAGVVSLGFASNRAL
ncbi:MAG TPA: aminopeptidase, partial [Gemmatimonadales bacterium]|nr:aminopeptidase [Gemmatimonadales bacterium]